MVVPVLTYEHQESIWGMDTQFHTFLTMALNVGGHLQTTATLAWGKKVPGTQQIAGWMNPIAGLDTVEESTEKYQLLLPGTVHCPPSQNPQRTN